jgi:hypothetical protein
MNASSRVATGAPPPTSPIKVLAAVFGIVLGGVGLAAAVFAGVIGYMRDRHVDAIWQLTAAIAYGLAILTVVYVASRVGIRLSGRRIRPAAARYNRRFFTVMALYTLTLLVSISVYTEFHPPQPLVWLLAIAPALPLLGAIVVMGLYYREETDELERAIASEAVLWATGALLAIATVWGFLEEFKLVVHVEAWAAFPIWAVGLGLAQALVRRRYR